MVSTGEASILFTLWVLRKYLLTFHSLCSEQHLGIVRYLEELLGKEVYCVLQIAGSWCRVRQPHWTAGWAGHREAGAKEQPHSKSQDAWRSWGRPGSPSQHSEELPKGKPRDLATSCQACFLDTTGSCISILVHQQLSLDVTSSLGSGNQTLLPQLFTLLYKTQGDIESRLCPTKVSCNSLFADLESPAGTFGDAAPLSCHVLCFRKQCGFFHHQCPTRHHHRSPET